MADAAMPGPGGAGQLDPQAVRLLMQMLTALRQNGPQAWPQLFQMAVRAGIPQELLPPPNAPPNVIAQFAKKLVMFLRAYRTGAQQPRQGGAQAMQNGGPVLDVTSTPSQPAMAMAYGGPVLDVTAMPDRPAMAMAYGGQVLDVTSTPAQPAMAMARGGRMPPGDTELIAATPGEYVASRGALQLDPTLDDRIRALNIAANGQEGPIMLAQGDTIPRAAQSHYIESLFGGRPASPAAPAQPDRGYNTTRDKKADADAQKLPSNDVMKRHVQGAVAEGKRNQAKREKGR